jgi:acyl transferase domain-containing protein
MSDINLRIERMTPLQKAVFALKETQRQLAELTARHAEPIALVGISCRFPGGVSAPDQFWRLLCEGRKAIGEIPAERWDVDAHYDPDPAKPGKMNTRWMGCVEGVDLFDNQFFGMSEREARVVDPQQRMVLELTWEALEDAGIPPSTLRGKKTGVFLAIGHCDYLENILDESKAGNPFLSTGTARSVAANRINFHFDFRGPSVAIDTACSSSLVALHMACQSLRNGEAETAIVSGVNLVLSPLATVSLTKAGFCSATGEIRAFDAGANGYVRSDGAGAIVLKPLSAAQRDGDHIYAVVRGSAVNHNGTSNGLTAPRAEAQEAVVREAFEHAGLDPRRARYVEAQGTGTAIGDAIEAAALGRVMAGGKCRIGSVKTNIGHCELASGMASLIKVALAIEHRFLPASLNFDTANPNIPFESLPLKVQTQSSPWPEANTQPQPTMEGDGETSPGEDLLIAGVSSFGFGGTNAHVVVSSERVAADTTDTGSGHRSQEVSAPDAWPLLLSARSQPALHALAARYVAWLPSSNSSLEDICYTSLAGRDHHSCRLAVVVRSRDEAILCLQAFLQGEDCPEVFVSATSAQSRLEVPTNGALQRADASRSPARQLAQAYVSGAEVSWSQLFGLAATTTPGRKVRLPLYPWQKRRLWIEPVNVRGSENVPQTVDRTINSKVSRPEVSTPYVAPQTKLEQILVEAWCETLQLDRVGTHDSFFELGGDSLMAASLLNKLQAEADETIQLLAVFQSQTVKQLAAYLEQSQPTAAAKLCERVEVAMRRNGATVDIDARTSSRTGDSQSADQPIRSSRIRKLQRAQSASSVDIDSLSDAEVQAMLRKVLEH